MLSSKIKLVLILLIFVSISAFAILVKKNLFSSNTSHEVSFPNNPKVILAGDSHGQTGFATEYINSSINVCQSSEAPIFTYYKLKKILESKNRINSVILSYSYHSLSKIRILGLNAEMLKRYHLIVDDTFYKELREQGQSSSSSVIRYLADVKKIPIGISNDVVEYIEMNRSNNPDRFSFLGGYEYNFASVIGNEKYLNLAIKRHYYSENEILDFDLTNLRFIRKISDLCMKHYVRLYLVNTPIHRLYYAKIPISFIEKVDSFGNSFHNQNTLYINLSQFDLPDSCYADYDHLNWHGSKIISKHLNLVVSGQAQGQL